MESLEKIDGPECPGCGCNDSTVLGTVTRWGQAIARRRCENCGLRWSPPAPPVKHIVRVREVSKEEFENGRRRRHQQQGR